MKKLLISVAFRIGVDCLGFPLTHHHKVYLNGGVNPSTRVFKRTKVNSSTPQPSNLAYRKIKDPQPTRVVEAVRGSF